MLTGDVSSEAAAVSADGSVVVGSSQGSSGKSQAFRWTREAGMLGLGVIEGGTRTSARAASADGSVIVGNGDALTSSSAMFVWRASTGLTRFAPLADPSLCAVSGISADGTIIVGTCLAIGDFGFRWTEATGIVSLGQFGGGSDRTSSAAAVSGDGSTIVGRGHPVLNGAMRWSITAPPEVIGKLPGDTESVATAVSHDGSVAAGYSTLPSSHRRAFRWTQQSGLADIGSPSGSLIDVVANAISGDGQVVLGWANTPTGEAALIWDPSNGMRRLDEALMTDFQFKAAGWTLSRATGVSNDGRTIVGTGISPDGRPEGWVLTLPASAQP